MHLTPEIIKKIIVGSGFVKEKEFDEASKTAFELGKEITDILIFRGLINEDTVGKLISDHFGVPFANVRRLNIPPEVLSLIPEKMARVYKAVPFEKVGGKLKVAMENPEDFEALEFAKRHTGLIIEPHFATRDDLAKALGQYRKSIKEDFEKIISENIKKVEPGEEEDLAKAAGKVPVVKTLDTIFGYALSEKASDIHIETQEEEVVVRFRIDGTLRDIVKFPRGIEIGLVARIKILSNLKIDEHRIPQDGRYKFILDDDVVSLRISIIPGFYGENVVMRLLQETNRPLSLEELGLTGHNLDVLRAVLNILNTIEVKICTIEDPIEYAIGRVTQIQVNPKTGVEFSAGLRALMRHDPDIIMVGEIRDKETAEIAIHSALTGHLVLSTLHTNTAAGAIPRFLDMGAEDFLLASTLNVIIAQRLVRKICNSCITKYSPGEVILKKLSKDLGIDLGGQKFYKGEGCGQCGQKGYTGRIGIYEALEITEKIKELVTNRATSDDIQKTAISEGMVTMLQDGLDKVSSGLTTIEEVIRVVREN